MFFIGPSCCLNTVKEGRSPVRTESDSAEIFEISSLQKSLFPHSLTCEFHK